MQGDGDSSVYRDFDYAAMVRELADGLPDLEHVICVGDTDVGDVLSSNDLLRATPDRSFLPRRQTADDDRGARLHLRDDRRAERCHALGGFAAPMIDDLVEHSGFGHGLTSLVISPIGHMTGFLWGS